MASIPIATLADVTGNTGLSQPFDTTQPSLAMNYIVALEGATPSPGGSVPNEQFLGQVVPFAGNFAPGGWAFADRQLLSIDQNLTLFSILGTTYGGDGQNTFALPDLRGRSAIGVGQGAGLSNRFSGEQTGVSQLALTDAQMPNHLHILPGGQTTGFEGGNQPVTNMKPSLALNYSINLEGIFPHFGGSGATPFPILGQLNLYAGNYNFNNSPAAAGQLMAPLQNEALFNLLGTNYGGNGVDTFALPDLRGRTPIGSGQGPGLANVNLGDMPGHEESTLTIGQLPDHFHALPNGGFTDPAGGNQPFENMEPSIALNYIIAVNGIFPSRDSSNVSNLPFIGEISLFAGNFAPDGWMFAQGQILPISQNTALFAILGTSYGGNGQSTFALPDLRGRNIVGAGQGPGLPNWVIGQQDGSNSIVLNVSQLPDHNHTLPIPEPSGITLILLGAASFTAFRWRRGVR